MSKAKHPKPYNRGPRKQMTAAWKQLVLDRLEENEAAGVEPLNMDQLAAKVGAAKGGLNRTFDLELKPQQTSSSYVDKICEVLGIDPPLQELNRDDQKAVDSFLNFSPELRQRMLEFGNRLIKK